MAVAPIGSMRMGFCLSPDLVSPALWGLRVCSVLLYASVLLCFAPRAFCGFLGRFR